MNYHFLSKMLSLLTLTLLFPLCPASPISPEAANAGAANTDALEGKLSTEGTTTFDGASLAGIEAKPDAATVIGSDASISQAGWTVVADSAEAGYAAADAIDGSTSTFWHTEYTPVTADLPHMITIDMGASYLVGSITYLPRQDGGSNGNIGQHQIQLSADGDTFTTVALGTWIDDDTLKTTIFTPTNGQYMRIVALSEAGDRGPWSSSAEINIYTAAGDAPPSPVGMGAWGPTIEFPLVPCSATIEWSSGNLLVWSSYNPSTFGGSNDIQTITATYDPATALVTQALITNTAHDMFCEGLSMDFSGQVFATGGNTDDATSYYDSPSNSWAAAATMQIPRGYQAQVTISTGEIFVIGASWSGGQGGKNGEIYAPGANTWTLLPGCPVAPMLTADAQGIFRADNHGWLFAWSDGNVFQAGPSAAMNWYGTADGGSQVGAGTRASDTDSMAGDAAMYDAVAGKILTVGGAPDYQDADATSNAHIITLGAPGDAPTVATINNMAYERSFANSVILPDGTVFITGGQSYADPFSDADSAYTPELFDPATETFTQLAPMAIPRNYHSVGILLPDATVGNGGGGLCGDCATNHYDMQIFTPPYLFDGGGGLAARPVISSVSTGSVAVGTSFTATTAGGVDSFSIIRLTSTTHTVNTDQRRIALTPSGTAGTTYTLDVPADPGVAVPGVWYLFAIAGGVPSVASYITITP